MESFAIRLTNWPVLRLFSRNPLVRGSDRVEEAVVALAVLLVVVAAACAGVLGTLAHDMEKQKYLGEAATRHTVTATALKDSTPSDSATSTLANVTARWQANGTSRADTLTWTSPVKAGEPLHIWIDSNGDIVDAPTPVTQAARDAVVIAFVAWWVAVLLIAYIAGVVRASISRVRDAQWEKGIHDLAEKGGWPNYS
jgi:hypothetical protein